MESEKVKEIKKALECCSGDCTKDCPLFGYNKNNDYKTLCRDVLIKKSLTLINELESENERLNNERSEVAIKNHRLALQNIELLDENQQIKDRIALLEKDNELLRNAKVVYENVDYCYEDLKKAEKRIAELEKEKTCIWEEWTDGDHSIWCCSNCKEDFCFIEGDVYENNYGYCPHCGAKITALKEMQEEQIDETLKEFIKE